MPRPYWAAAPESCRSWVTSTLVPRPERASVAVTTMLAWPLPFSSAPLACTTTRWAASSRSVMSAVPAKLSLTGPIRTATRPWYFSPPRSPVSSAPGRQAATCGMLPKNCQTFSIGSATSKPFLISIGTPFQVGSGIGRELVAAAGPAEVVGGTPVLQPEGRGSHGHGHPAHRVNGLLRPGRAGRPASGQGPRRAQLDQLRQNRHRDLPVRRPAEVEAGRDAHAGQLLPRHAALREIAQHRRPAPGRPHQAQVGGAGGHRVLDRLLIAVALGGHHDQRPLAHVAGGEAGAVDEVGPPAERGGHAGERVRH